MPARADSRLDFTRGFGLDVPDEADEEQEETETDEQVVAEVQKEEPMLAKVSHIAVPGADDTIDMDIEEEDAEVCNITTVVHSRVHSRHLRDCPRRYHSDRLLGTWTIPSPRSITTGKLKGKLTPRTTRSVSGRAPKICVRPRN